MRNSILTAVLLLASITLSSGQYDFEQQSLCRINQHWKNVTLRSEDAKQVRACKNYTELIQLHLQLVTEHLIQTTAMLDLDVQTEQSRLKSIEALTRYYRASIFPQNLKYSYATPIFVDDIGTHCAVGYLIHESGHDEIVSKIVPQDNLAYVAALDVKYPELGSWAKENGFTVDELAWIQPAYSCHPDLEPGEIIHVSCYGGWDGAFLADVSQLGNPGSSYSYGDTYLWEEDNWINVGYPDCLSAGHYKQEIFVSELDTNYIVEAFVDIEQPDSLSVTYEITGDIADCEAQIQPYVSGGTPPYNLSLYAFNLDSVPFSSLCEGLYWLQIEDSKGCTTVKTINLSQSEITDCHAFCITDVALDTIFQGYLNLTLYFEGDSSSFINYPYIETVMDENGDTVAMGSLNFFGQIGNSSQVYQLETSLTSLPPDFSGTALFHYDTSVCILLFPCTTSTDIALPTHSNLRVFPNPASSEINIHYEKGFEDHELMIYNAQGEKVETIQHVYGREVRFEKANLVNGIYYILILKHGKQVAGSKLVIKE